MDGAVVLHRERGAALDGSPQIAEPRQTCIERIWMASPGATSTAPSGPASKAGPPQETAAIARAANTASQPT